VTDPFGRFGGYLNSRGGLARGVEAQLVATPTSTTDLSVSYTYTNADQRVPLVEDVITSFASPEHQVSVVVTQRIGSRLSVSFDFIGTDEYLAPIYDPSRFSSRPYSFDGLRKGDVSAAYSIPLGDTKSIRVFGKVENLFDRTYFENGFATPGALGTVGIRFDF